LGYEELAQTGQPEGEKISGQEGGVSWGRRKKEKKKKKKKKKKNKKKQKKKKKKKKNTPKKKKPQIHSKAEGVAESLSRSDFNRSIRAPLRDVQTPGPNGSALLCRIIP